MRSKLEMAIGSEQNTWLSDVQHYLVLFSFRVVEMLAVTNFCRGTNVSPSERLDKALKRFCLVLLSWACTGSQISLRSVTVIELKVFPQYLSEIRWLQLPPDIGWEIVSFNHN